MHTFVFFLKKIHALVQTRPQPKSRENCAVGIAIDDYIGSFRPVPLSRQRSPPLSLL